jgi:large subunit ribosomal protein L18
MSVNISKNQKRIKRKTRIRKKISGTELCPRLNVFRSSRHIYAQIIDDSCGHTLVSASTIDKEFKSFVAGFEPDETNGKKTYDAISVGRLIAKRALEKGIKKVIYDRNGFIYHGRIKALSDGAREAGLDF